MDFRNTKIPEAVLQAMDIRVKRIAGDNREYEIYDSLSGNTGKIDGTVSSFKRVVKLKDISLNKEKLNEDFLSISTKIESSEKELQVIMDYNKKRFEMELKNLISVCQKNIEKTGIKAKIWIEPKYYAGKKIKVFYDSLDGKTQLSKVDEHVLMIYLEMLEKELNEKGFLAIDEKLDIHNYDFAEYSVKEKEKEAYETYAKMAFSICGEKPKIKMLEPYSSICWVFSDETYEKHKEKLMELYYSFYEYFDLMGNNVFLSAPVSESIFNEYQAEEYD
jgi:hypothetical protein